MRRDLDWCSPLITTLHTIMSGLQWRGAARAFVFYDWWNLLSTSRTTASFSRHSCHFERLIRLHLTKRLFVLLNSPHLIWPHLSWPHFVWSECAVIGSNRRRTGSCTMSVMSHLATLSCNFDSGVKFASVTWWHVARCDVACRRVAQLVSRIERCNKWRMFIVLMWILVSIKSFVWRNRFLKHDTS